MLNVGGSVPRQGPLVRGLTFAVNKCPPLPEVAASRARGPLSAGWRLHLTGVPRYWTEINGAMQKKTHLLLSHK